MLKFDRIIYPEILMTENYKFQHVIYCSEKKINAVLLNSILDHGLNHIPCAITHY